MNWNEIEEELYKKYNLYHFANSDFYKANEQVLNLFRMKLKEAMESVVIVEEQYTKISKAAEKRQERESELVMFAMDLQKQGYNQALRDIKKNIDKFFEE